MRIEKLTSAFKINWQAIFPFLIWLPLVNKASLRADISAAITGAAIVLPQGVAFAAIAGLPPQYGLYTAMITPVVAALFGSSMYLVSGPTSAISALLLASLSGQYEIGTEEFISAALALTLIVGVIQLVFGLAKLGRLMGFVSHSVMIGFTTGAAILIALSQIKHILGIEIPRTENIFHFLQYIFENLEQISLLSVIIGFVTLLAAVLSKKIMPKWPNYLIALIVGGALSLLLGGEEQNIKVVGLIPSVFPSFSFPSYDRIAVGDIFQSALAIAIIGLLEAVSIAKALSYKGNEKFDSTQEIVGQGMSNIVGSFFSAYVGSGSFTRSGVNYEAGAKTPLAAIFASLALLLILFFVAPLFAYIPIPAMAGVIILVAYKLIDFKKITHIILTSKAETLTICVTFFSTLIVGLEFAVYAGVLVSLGVFLSGTRKASFSVNVPDPSMPNHGFMNSNEKLSECPQLLFCQVEGPLYFGSVDSLRNDLRNLEKQRPDQKSMILKISGVGHIDFAAAELLIEENERRNKRGGRLYLTTKYPFILEKLIKYKVISSIGEKNVYLHRNEAISEIVPTLSRSVCDDCQMRIFRECPESLRFTTSSVKSSNSLTLVQPTVSLKDWTNIYSSNI